MFEQLSDSSGNALGLKIGEDITGEDIDNMSRIMSEIIAAYGKIRLLVEIEGFRHMEPEFLMEKLRFAKDHAGEIERMAFLSNRIWIKSWVKVGGLLTHTDVEHFYLSEMEAAWKWIHKERIGDSTQPTQGELKELQSREDYPRI